LYTFTAISLILAIFLSYIAPRAVLFWCAQMWAKGVFIIIGTRLHVSGREHIPSNKKFMILSNHASLFDIPAIMAVFPNVAWLGRDYLTRIPVFSHMLTRMNYIAVGRNPALNVRLIIQKAIMNSDKLRVCLFPEGTRSMDGDLREFKRGFIHIMNGGDLDILPVVMNGLFDVKPKTRFSIKPCQRVEIIICKPIKRTTLVNLPNEEIIKRVRHIFVSNYSNEKGDGY
jgi:1-acyl-sn-glycerol-3-phosphate acyltransferase